MTFSAMPFSNSAANTSLSQKFGVRGIPTLVILNGKDGSLIDDKGRATVMEVKGDVKKAFKKWLP